MNQPTTKTFDDGLRLLYNTNTQKILFSFKKEFVAPFNIDSSSNSTLIHYICSSRPNTHPADIPIMWPPPALNKFNESWSPNPHICSSSISHRTSRQRHGQLSDSASYWWRRIHALFSLSTTTTLSTSVCLVYFEERTTLSQPHTHTHTHTTSLSKHSHLPFMIHHQLNLT